jgi:hypothetical protein
VIKTRRMRWARHTVRTAEINTYAILVGKLQRKSALGRPRHEWDGNTKVDLLK